METIRTIEERRSIRSFKEDNISKNVIEDILNCGRLSPSAKNRQPWYFVVLTGENKNKVAEIMISGNTKEVRKYDREVLKCNTSILPTARTILEAPVLVLVFREKDDNWVIADNLSIGACIENMCLRATDLELGTLWIRDVVYNSNDIATFLGKGNMELNSALAIGVPNESPKVRPRKKLEDIVEWY